MRSKAWGFATLNIQAIIMDYRMNPSKVNRESITQLTDLPNIGKTIAHDLKSIGIDHPDQLKGQDPYSLYVKLCKAFGERQDPCLLDVLMSITDFMNGGKPRVWWEYTNERKRVMAIKSISKSEDRIPDINQS